MVEHTLQSEMVCLPDWDCTVLSMVVMQGAQVAGGLIGAAAAINYIPKPWLGCVLYFHTEINGFLSPFLSAHTDNDTNLRLLNAILLSQYRDKDYDGISYGALPEIKNLVQEAG
jgi:hypothetical protein